ncbi:protein HEG homolog 1-like [Sycon ciliatum]|uniref:protein HEG homolog 1-like n=1 Tax=Sycon ciliatum TaxID=27933 RepID=UPI0031F64EF8
MSPQAFLSTILLLLATAVFSLANPLPMAGGVQSAGNGSCMVLWMLQSGVELAMADKYEGVFKTIGMTETKLVELDTSVLAFLMGMTESHATMLKSCLNGTNPLCADSFDPCNTEGECAFNTDSRSYMCQCQPGRTGHYCENEIDECASEPCQNDGSCVDAFNSFSCNCSVGHTGDVCQTRWLTLAVFEALNANVAILESQLAEANRTIRASLNANVGILGSQLAEANRTIRASLNANVGILESQLAEANRTIRASANRINKLEGPVSTLQVLQQCNPASLGFAYTTQLRYTSGNIQLASLRFTKKRESTLLRITYSTSVGTYGKNTGSLWYAKVDGQECTQPSRISIAHFRQNYVQVHIPGYLEGLCRATSAGPIKQGSHVITIHTGQIGGIEHNAFSGFAVPSLLQVKEICDQ